MERSFFQEPILKGVFIMGRIKNAMKIIEESVGKINVAYEMSVENIDQIYEASNDPFGMISNGFRFGYMQGMKAAKAEMRKGGVA
jgi:hypothetical protein